MTIILHIPHSSTYIPDNIRDQFVLSDKELSHELQLMTDAYTDDLFMQDDPEIESVIFPISRLVIDPERFIDDQLEPMSKIGMGVIYAKTSHGKHLRRPISTGEREFLINTYYRLHHENLTNVVEKALLQNGSALIIDCHSFPSTSLPYEFNQSPDRPDVCIGTDDFHTPENLCQTCAELFQQKGYSVRFNKPFSGSLVPIKYYQKNKDVYSIMIEINRRLYMGEETGGKSTNYDQVKSDIKWLLTQIHT